MFKTTVIIPTYNRPTELRDCIQSILNQTVKPDELIIVDDGNLLELPLENESRDAGIRYIYLKKEKPGLTASRNEGIKLASGDIIFFLDDDVILSPDYLEEINKVYEADREGIIGGVGGAITNHESLTLVRRIFEIFFLISGFREGKVLPSGFCTDFGRTGFPIREIKEVDFLSVGASSFRKEIFQEFSFDTEKYRNYGLGEDKDFSYRVSKKYKLFINPTANLLHLESPKMRMDKNRLGRDFVADRYLFFKNHVKRGWWSWLFFYYAFFGYIIMRTIIFIVSPSNKSEGTRIKGILSAVRDILRGRL